MIQEVQGLPGCAEVSHRPGVLGHPGSSDQAFRPQADGTIGSDNPIGLQGVRYDGVISVGCSDFREGQLLAALYGAGVT